jgi:hypothetical protein
MIRLLHSPVLTPSRKLQMISKIVYPEGIEKMYCRILSIIEESGELQVAAAKQIFCWLAFAKVPLTVGHLYEAVHKCRVGSSTDSIQDIQTFREMISVVCGSLVEFYTPASGHVEQQPLTPSLSFQSGVRFIHISVGDHLTQTQTTTGMTGGSLAMDRMVANLTLARETLDALLWADPLSAVFDTVLSKYAVSYWMKHLHASIDHEIPMDLARSQPSRHSVAAMLTSLSSFLEAPLVITRWIYSFYKTDGSMIHGKLPYSELKDWVEWLESSNYFLESAQDGERKMQQMKEFIRDMERLVREWHPKLHAEPETLWNEVVAFTNSIFLCKTNTSIKVKRLALTDSKRPNQSTRPLGEVSASSSDGQMNFRLSVWPSKAFEERWGNLQLHDSIARVKDVSCGWSMRYEVWSIETETCMGEIEIPLDEKEIWLAMRQMLHEKDVGDWSTGFPMAISANGSLVSILRTVYSLRYHQGAVTWKKALVPTHFIGASHDHWNESQEPFDPNHRLIRDHPVKSLFRNRYTYSMEFSAMGKHLLFMDTLRRGTITHQFAVFQICNEDKLDVKGLASWSNSELAISLSAPVKATIHPEVPVIVICDRYMVGLWEYLEGITPVCFIFHTLPGVVCH